ncbi:MAG: dihydroneopterin aldolase [Planctomycetota bacterium]
MHNDPPDAVFLEDLSVTTHIGVPDEERAQAQELILSVRVGADLRDAAASDDVTATLDYDRLCRDIKTLSAARPRKLLETLAAEICDHVLAYPVARRVEVRIVKPAISTAGERLGVAMTRFRDN